MILCPVCGTLPNVPAESDWLDKPSRGKWAICSCRMTCFKTHMWQWRFGRDSSFQNPSTLAKAVTELRILVRVPDGELLLNGRGGAELVRPEDVPEIIRELTVASVLES